MATLYDLAMQYLNQSLPKTFKYDRTNQPGIPTPVLPVQPDDPKKLLPVQGGGGDGFSVYNPDPNSISNKNYSPYAYRQAAERNLIGTPGGSLTGTNIPNTSTEVAKLMDMYPDYYKGKQLEGIPGAIEGYLKNSIPGRIIGGIGKFANDYIFKGASRRAILENELAGQGIMVNDIGQIVSDGGNINTAENIMAGYNANKVTAETFQKRRDMINAKMSNKVNPKTGKTFKQEKLDALDGAEAKMLGTATDRADMIFEEKMIEKDPSLKGPGYLEDSFDFDPTNIYNTNSIYTQTAPTYITDPYVSGEDDKDIGTTPPGTSDDGYVTDYYGGDPVTDAGGTAPGGGYATDYYGGDSVTDAGGTAPGGGYATDYYGGGGDQNTGVSVGPDNEPNPGDTDTFNRETGNENDSGSNTKIVCTMMNESYGFGSFRNKIWLKHSKGLAPEYQKGYHKLFLPLVKIAKTNKVVRKILEHIAVHRTIDIRQESRGKVHLLGRVYRKILEPLCYFVGKHG